MTTGTSGAIVASGFRLPEGLRWRDGRLWMSDMDGGVVLSIGPAGPEVVCEVPAQPSGLGWDPEGSLLVVSQLDHRLLRLHGDRLETVADLAPVLLAQGGDVRPNDMLVEADGTAYIGSYEFVERDGQLVAADAPTPLLRVSPEGEVTVLTSELRCPNGILPDPAGGSLIVAETRASRIVDIALRGPEGAAAVRTRATLPSGPDGLCLDADGAIWAALPFAGAVQRIDADGTVTATLDLAPRVPLDCTVGGTDGTTLLVGSVERIDHLGTSRTGRIDAFELDADITLGTRRRYA
jgi:sugar lactone lactonase YvrE